MDRDFSPIIHEYDIGEDDSMMDYGSQALEVSDEEPPHADPKWTAFMREDDDIDLKPKISIEERIRLNDEKEKQLYALAKSRGLPTIPDDYVPKVTPAPAEPSEESKRERYRQWREKLARIRREKEILREENRKFDRLEYEKYAKIQKDYHTRDYYWKPDPLYALRLKQIGYSKIAIDRALYSVENASVEKAMEYLRKNPNPTELTKEEIIEEGEEVIGKLRNKLLKHHRPVGTLPIGGDMEMEQCSQPVFGDSSGDLGVSDSCPEEERTREEIQESPRGNPSEAHKEHGHGMTEDEIRRGVKRNHAGEEIKQTHQSSSSKKTRTMPVVKEIAPEYKMVFVVNTSLMMDAITLSLEVGKVVANLTNKVRNGSDEVKKMFDCWIEEGEKMCMYKGNRSGEMNSLYDFFKKSSLIAHLGICSHYRQVKTPSPTVLGLFGETKQMKRLPLYMEML